MLVLKNILSILIFYRGNNISTSKQILLDLGITIQVLEELGLQLFVNHSFNFDVSVW